MPDAVQGVADLLTGAVAAGAYVVDRSGRVTSVNRTTLELLGFDEGKVLGRAAHDLWHYVDATGHRRASRGCPITAVAATGRAESSDRDVFVCRDGRLLPVGWTSVPIVDPGGPGAALVVFHDISGQRVELRAADDLAEVRAGDPAAAGPAARTAFLTEITLALISTLDVDEALARLARMLVPRFADWCVIDLIELDDADRVRRVTVAHTNPAAVRELGPVVTTRFPLPPPPGPPLARVLRGVPSLVLAQPDATGSSTEMERQQGDLFRRLGASEALVVGLQARTRTIGAVTMVRTGGRHFTVAERALAEDVALRAGIAVDNARLYTDTRSAAEALQRSLLPVLPAHPRITLAGTYLPAGRGAEVGGDWYDAYWLGGPSAALGVALGDVAGHDLQAAARMSDIRTLLRAASLVDDDPAAVLTRLDRAMAVFHEGVTATAVYARVEPAGDGVRVRWANAGHPPPLLLTPAAGGPATATFLDGGGGTLLGAAPDLPRASAIVDLAPGAMLVLYSDGLVEDRETGLAPGMARLRQAASVLAPAGPEHLNAHLLSDLGLEPADDVAVLVVAAR
ncbi:MAG TPA: SpoIIE family protein phosphatase [Acidimicrobiales bacterium]|nr:SpoIIE family protein phosphatase [Acidimicrobiales bacterium]